jgi:hypothetical protein
MIHAHTYIHHTTTTIQFFFTHLPFFWAGWLPSVPVVCYMSYIDKGRGRLPNKTAAEYCKATCPKYLGMRGKVSTSSLKQSVIHTQ